MEPKHQGHAKKEVSGAYRRLLFMAVLSFGAMYALMYAMVARFADIYPNLNQFYMAALMAAPMVVIELVLMRPMYQDRRMNSFAFVAAAIVFIGSYMGIRAQAGISDGQFLRSMIPHHSGAILMCNEATITDPEIQELCRAIISSQAQEIAQMRSILERRAN